MQQYGREFYSDQQEGSRRSAREVVPLLMQLVGPRRVLDVGCGVGTWLSVFAEQGVSEVWGVDGDYVERPMLQIPAERFRPQDLMEPFQLEGPFDLVVSLEVAEHLPAERADSFVETLTAHGPVVLFSAATPFQGGTGHVNEQWPGYWLNLFRAREYEVIDCIRGRVWDNEKVEWWYAQNLLLYVRRDYLATHAALRAEQARTNVGQLSLVHPRHFMAKIAALQSLDPANRTLGETLSMLPGQTKSAVGKRVRRILSDGGA